MRSVTTSLSQRCVQQVRCVASQDGADELSSAEVNHGIVITVTTSQRHIETVLRKQAVRVLCSMAGSEALLASQINGGGCLPPPTPSAKPGGMFQSLQKHLETDGDKSNYEKYSGELPPSLAFRSSTRKAMVDGVGGFIDPNNLTVPENPADMGFIMKNGRLTRMDRPRINGPPEMRTSTEHAFLYHHQAQVLNM